MLAEKSKPDDEPSGLVQPTWPSIQHVARPTQKAPGAQHTIGEEFWQQVYGRELSSDSVWKAGLRMGYDSGQQGEGCVTGHARMYPGLQVSWSPRQDYPCVPGGWHTCRAPNARSLGEVPLRGYPDLVSIRMGSCANLS